jgi:hypothetical protein
MKGLKQSYNVQTGEITVEEVDLPEFELVNALNRKA